MADTDEIQDERHKENARELAAAEPHDGGLRDEAKQPASEPAARPDREPLSVDRGAGNPEYAKAQQKREERSESTMSPRDMAQAGASGPSEAPSAGSPVSPVPPGVPAPAGVSQVPVPEGKQMVPPRYEPKRVDTVARPAPSAPADLSSVAYKPNKADTVSNHSLDLPAGESSVSYEPRAADTVKRPAPVEPMTVASVKSEPNRADTVANSATPAPADLASVTYKPNRLDTVPPAPAAAKGPAGIDLPAPQEEVLAQQLPRSKKLPVQTPAPQKAESRASVQDLPQTPRDRVAVGKAESPRAYAPGNTPERHPGRTETVSLPAKPQGLSRTEGRGAPAAALSPTPEPMSRAAGLPMAPMSGMSPAGVEAPELSAGRSVLENAGLGMPKLTGKQVTTFGSGAGESVVQEKLGNRLTGTAELLINGFPAGELNLDLRSGA